MLLCILLAMPSRKTHQNEIFYRPATGRMSLKMLSAHVLHYCWIKHTVCQNKGPFATCVEHFDYFVTDTGSTEPNRTTRWQKYILEILTKMTALLTLSWEFVQIWISKILMSFWCCFLPAIRRHQQSAALEQCKAASVEVELAVFKEYPRGYHHSLLVPVKVSWWFPRRDLSLIHRSYSQKVTRYKTQAERSTWTCVCVTTSCHNVKAKNETESRADDRFRASTKVTQWRQQPKLPKSERDPVQDTAHDIEKLTQRKTHICVPIKRSAKGALLKK